MRETLERGACYVPTFARLGFYILCIDTMEHLTAQQRAPILERFAYFYENAGRFREYILSNMGADKLERALADGRELLRHTYDGIF